MNRVVIGVGNAYRHDDAVGLVVVRQLQPATHDQYRVLELSGEGTSLMDAWANADAAVVVDATSSGAKPGTIIRLDVAATAVRSSLFRYSSHAFGLAEAIELARALGQLPRRLLVFGIEGADFTMGEGLSPEVNAAVPTVVAAITDEMGVRPPAQH